MKRLISAIAFLAILATHVNAQTTPTTVILTPELRVAPSATGNTPTQPTTFRLMAEAYLSPGFKVGPSASLVVNGGKIGSLVITNETFLPGRTFGEILYLPAGTEIPFGSESRGGIVGTSDAPKFGGLAATVGGSVFPAGSPVSTTAINSEVSALRADFNNFRATPPTPANMATRDDLVALKTEVSGMITAAVKASELRTDAKLARLREDISKDTDAKLEALKNALRTPSATPSATATVNVTNSNGATSVVANLDWENHYIGGFSYGRRPSDGSCYQLMKISCDQGRTWNKLEWRAIAALPSN